LSTIRIANCGELVEEKMNRDNADFLKVYEGAEE
jgi:hypothetical protein